MRGALRLLFVTALLLPQAANAADLVVIANRGAGIDRLTRYQVLDIYLGRYRTFPSGIAAMPIDLAVKSGEREAFYQTIARKDAAEISAYWARLIFSGQGSPPFQISDSRAAVELVASNRNAIAYVERSAVDKRVKVILELTE